jgi:NDP-sugar pyrophosphorylase family protein
MHNADILTDLALEPLYEANVASGTLATLAVRPPETDRYLLFDAAGVLCGYAYGGTETLVQDPEGDVLRADFCGVQVIHPRIFDLMTERGVFSIIDVYLRLVQAGERVEPFMVDAATNWLDVGTPERLRQARILLADWGTSHAS